MNKSKFICSICGETINEETTHEFDNRLLCEHCFQEFTTTCDHCQTRIWRENAEGDSNYTLCSNCYEYAYTTCENCGRLIHNDDSYYENDEPYCYDCYQKLEENPIKSYNYKPEPIFYGSGDLFIATLQLVYEICRFAIMLSDNELESMSWSDFVSRIALDKKELIEYLKSKRLYVNEMPQETEAI